MNYKVFDNGEQLETKGCRIYPKPYNSVSIMEYVMFSICGREDIIIESEAPIESAVIRPLSAKIPFELKNGKIYMSVDKPVKASVEINGSSVNNLMLFAHDKNCGAFKKNENCIIIKKDEENVGTVTVNKDNTTVYLEDGAVLNGNIYAEHCNNLTICGLGKICMERYTYEMRKDFARSIDIKGCSNVHICDIIIDDSNDWSMRINGCDNVTINNVKIFGCRGNSDGIDVCGSRNVTVSDIFTRVWDDSFVVKSLGTGNTENILFKDSVLWNDFARPMEVGVELRADKIKNIRFENIDVIHSSTGYPIMGIHHGDHARVSDITFNNIRIEDTPGAQLFDIRIADSVWNRDNAMGDIRDVTFSNIDYIGTKGNNILLSNSRIEGFDEQHDIQNVKFENIAIKGRTVKTAEELGIDICSYVSGVSVKSELDLEEALILSSDVRINNKFKKKNDGKLHGSVAVCLTNNTSESISGKARFAVSPKNTAEEKEFEYNINPNESAEYVFDIALQPGKYVFFLKDEKNIIENKWLYKELDAEICQGTDIMECPSYHIINYYNNDSVKIRISAEEDKLVLMNEADEKTDFTLYTAMPVEAEEGEVLFSAEETDFGEVCAVIKKGDTVAAAPQLRSPLEITYVFKNEPKVKEIVKTEISLKSGEIIKIPFEELGIDGGAESFLMELAAKAKETAGLRYPYTLFHSTMPEKTAHMFGRIKIRERK